MKLQNNYFQKIKQKLIQGIIQELRNTCVTNRSDVTTFLVENYQNLGNNFGSEIIKCDSCRVPNIQNDY